MTPTPIEQLPYRRGVGIMLLSARDEVFVAQRLDAPSTAWQMPQGGIDDGEEPQAAALRELAEETGTSNVSVLAESRGWLTYDLPAALIPKVWGGRFRGQTQKWFAMRFLGRDSDIDIATAQPEFSDWRWIAPQRLPELIIPFKRRLYLDLLTEFADLLGTEAGDQR